MVFASFSYNCDLFRDFLWYGYIFGNFVGSWIALISPDGTVNIDLVPVSAVDWLLMVHWKRNRTITTSARLSNVQESLTSIPTMTIRFEGLGHRPLPWDCGSSGGKFIFEGNHCTCCGGMHFLTLCVAVRNVFGVLKPTKCGCHPLVLMEAGAKWRWPPTTEDDVEYFIHLCIEKFIVYDLFLLVVLDVCFIW